MQECRNAGELVSLPFLLLVFLYSCIPDSTAAKPLVGDMSEYQVNIDSTFTGKNIILFGAQNDPGEVLIVVRGPKRNVTIRKKREAFGGIWVNGESVEFQDIPFYYSINGLNRFEINDPLPTSYEAMEIGWNQVNFGGNGEVSPAQREEFKQAFLTLQGQKGLYRHFSEPLKFMGDTLFKTLISFPDTLPRGKYAVDMYLMEDGHLRGVQTLPISVEKSGFDAWVYDMAHHQAPLYALMAITIALSVGWGISQLFSRII